MASGSNGNGRAARLKAWRGSSAKPTAAKLRRDKLKKKREGDRNQKKNNLPF